MVIKDVIAENEVDEKYRYQLRKDTTVVKKVEDKITVHSSKLNLMNIYRHSAFIQRRALRHLPDRKSFLLFRSIALLVGKVISKGGGRSLRRTWGFLYPKTYKKMFPKWAHHLSASLIEFFYDVTFMMPTRTMKNYSYFLKEEGINFIQDALKKGKGVIAASVHLGHFIHTPLLLLYKHYERNGKQVPVFLAILSSSENEFLFREQAQKYANLDIVITNDFQKLKDGIERHLLLNHVVFILVDFSNAKQLRVPFIHGNKYYDFLMPSPQLASYFHFKFGTPVIPCLNFIRDDFSKTFCKYYPEIDLTRDPNSEQDILIRNELIRFQAGEMDENEEYGLLSTEINRILNPFILQYPFYWEEVYPFWKRSSYPIDLTQAEKIKEFVEIYAEGLLSLLNNSFEPGRDTKKIKNILEQIIISAKSVEPIFKIENRHLLINYDLGRKNWNSIIKEFQNTIQDSTEQVKNNEKVAKIWSLIDQLV